MASALTLLLSTIFYPLELATRIFLPTTFAITNANQTKINNKQTENDNRTIEQFSRQTNWPFNFRRRQTNSIENNNQIKTTTTRTGAIARLIQTQTTKLYNIATRVTTTSPTTPTTNSRSSSLYNRKNASPKLTNADLLNLHLYHAASLNGLAGQSTPAAPIQAPSAPQQPQTQLLPEPKNDSPLPSFSTTITSSSSTSPTTSSAQSTSVSQFAAPPQQQQQQQVSTVLTPAVVVVSTQPPQQQQSTPFQHQNMNMNRLPSNRFSSFTPTQQFENNNNNIQNIHSSITTQPALASTPAVSSIVPSVLTTLTSTSTPSSNPNVLPSLAQQQHKTIANSHLHPLQSHNSLANAKYSLDGIIAVGIFGGFIFLGTIITIIVIIIRR